MNNLFTTLIAFFCISLSYSQVGIGTTTPEGVLDVSSTTDGVLFPRLAADPVSAINGKIYYNTVSKDFIYYNGTAWVPMSNIYNSNGTLNSARTVTQNARKLTFSSTTGGFEYATNSGNFLISNTATATNLFSAHGTNNNVVIGGTSSTFGKFTILNDDAATDYDGLRISHKETASTALGFNLQMDAVTTANGFNIDNYGTGRTMNVYNRNTTTTSAPFFFRNTASSASLVVATETGKTTRGALIALNNRGTTFINTLPGYIGVQGEGRTTTSAEPGIGVYGAGIEDGVAVSGTSGAAGGMFSMFDNLVIATSTKVGTRNAGTNYKVLGITGAPVVSTSRENHEGKKVILFAPESPLPTYNDFGSGKLINGKAHIEIDPAFASMIYVDENNNAPLRVVIQLEGDCNGVYVTNKTSTSFDVIELQRGQSNAKFTYQIVGNQKDYIDPSTGIKNKLQDIRFPELNDKYNVGKQGQQTEK